MKGALCTRTTEKPLAGEIGASKEPNLHSCNVKRTYKKIWKKVHLHR